MILKLDNELQKVYAKTGEQRVERQIRRIFEEASTSNVERELHGLR